MVDMSIIAPKRIRFIKLGLNGEWEQECIQNNTIRLGYKSPYHKDCLDGDWDSVRTFWLNCRNGNEGAATRDVNQIRDFYELEQTDVWITFYKRKLNWCHAENNVIELEDGTRIRRVIGHWSYTDINGKPLRIDNLDGRVTQVQGYRGTICSIQLQEYLVRKINGLKIPEVENAKESLLKLKTDIEDLIKGLWWHDFELLVDLIFSKAGWQRFSVLGKTEKDIDLDVYSPTTQKRAFVQIKSTTNRSEVESIINSFNEYEEFDEMYIVFHTCISDLSGIDLQNSKISLWGLQQLSGLVVNAGIVEWLINKRS